MLKQHGTDWDKILSPFAFHKAATVQQVVGGVATSGATGVYGPECAVLLSLGNLTEWERGFVTSIAQRSTSVTEKQAPIWERIRQANVRVLVTHGFNV